MKKNKITVSAPGKLMLFGEHAVVYGRPCIVTAVDQRMKATVELTDEPIFQLNAPDVSVENYKKPMDQLGEGDPSTSPSIPRSSGPRGSGQGIPKGAKFVEIALKNFLTHARPGLTRLSGIKVTTKSEFNSQFGFGSSSASTVCVIKALSELTGAKLTNKAIFDLAYQTVLDIQGKGSGFDVAAAIYGGALYFVKGGKVIQPLRIEDLPLIVGYSGIKVDTVVLIDEVAKKAKDYPWVINNVYDQIGKLVEQAKIAILNKDWQHLGEIMNINEGYLATLGVEGKKLADMIYAAREAGAHGAKLSGAGIGDCMIALAPKKSKKAVEQAINKAGGQAINIKANVEGVRIEKNG